MATSSTFTDQLARAYREARVLVLGDRTPKVDRAFTLHREFRAVRAAYTEEQDGSISEWEATLLERTRRAIIVALRRQAVAIRERWSENRGSLEIEQSSPQVNLEDARQLSIAAMQLHLDGDPDVSRTAQVMEFIRQSIARVDAAPAPPLRDAETARPQEMSTAETNGGPTTSTLPTTPADAATFADFDSTPASLMDDGAAESVGPADRAGTFPSVLSRIMRVRPWAGMLATRRISPALVAAAALVLVIGTGSLVMRSGKGRPVVTSGAETRSAGSRVAEPPASLPAPSPARVTTVLLVSNPSGARVTVGGKFRGTTPLSLERAPGESLSIVVRKGNRVWRGVLTVSEDQRQTVTVRLPAPRIAQAPRPQQAPAVRSGQSRQAYFDTLMREGTELYKTGWFGPAAGRFREAATIDPRSPQAHLWLGRALIRSDRQTEARRALEKVIELAGTGPQADEAAMLLNKLP